MDSRLGGNEGIAENRCRGKDVRPVFPPFSPSANPRRTSCRLPQARGWASDPGSGVAGRIFEDRTGPGELPARSGVHCALCCGTRIGWVCGSGPPRALAEEVTCGDPPRPNARGRLPAAARSAVPECETRERSEKTFDDGSPKRVLRRPITASQEESLWGIWGAPVFFRI